MEEQNLQMASSRFVQDTVLLYELLYSVLQVEMKFYPNYFQVMLLQTAHLV